MDDSVMYKQTAMIPSDIVHDTHGLGVARLLKVYSKANVISIDSSSKQGGKEAVKGPRSVLGYDTDVDSRCVPVYMEKIDVSVWHVIATGVTLCHSSNDRDPIHAQ